MTICHAIVIDLFNNNILKFKLTFNFKLTLDLQCFTESVNGTSLSLNV